MEIKGWTIRGVCEEESGKLEEKDFTKEFMADEFVSLVMKRKFEQIQEKDQEKMAKVKKIEDTLKKIEEVSKIEHREETK